MFRRYLSRQYVVASSLPHSQVLTGQFANSTKIGRFAKLLNAEILGKRQRMSLVVFGDNLIGKSVKSMCIAREGFNDSSLKDPAINPLLCFKPTIINSPDKLRENIVSVEFIISTCEKLPESQYPPIHMQISSSLDHEDLAKKLHSLYLNGSVDSFELRCMGYLASATVVKALGLFNQRVHSHKLRACIHTEPVPNKYLRRGTSTLGESLRAIVFNVAVLDDPSD